MKKLISLFLAICTCLSVGMLITACEAETGSGTEHSHTFKTEWETDPFYHWHACDNRPCLEMSDRAEHVWDGGVMAVEPTVDVNGQMVYTCTVCNITMGKTVEFTGIGKEKWDAMLSADVFENYTLTERQYVTYEGVGMQQNAVFKVAGDKASVDLTVDGQHVAYLVYTGAEAAAQKASYEQIYLALLANANNFTYDKEANLYKTTETITVEIPMEIYNMSAILVMKNGKVALGDDGKLLKFECDYTQTTFTPEGSVSATTWASWTFSDYGTTVIADAEE